MTRPFKPNSVTPWETPTWTLTILGEPCRCFKTQSTIIAARLETLTLTWRSHLRDLASPKPGSTIDRWEWPPQPKEWRWPESAMIKAFWPTVFTTRYRRMQETLIESEVAPLLREAIALEQDVRDDPLLLGECMVQLATCELQTGNLAEAESLIREAAGIAPPAHGPRLPGAAGDLFMLCQCLLKEGKLDEAEAAAREVIEIHRRVLDKDHHSRANGIDLLGHVQRYVASGIKPKPCSRGIGYFTLTKRQILGPLAGSTPVEPLGRPPSSIILLRHRTGSE